MSKIATAQGDTRRRRHQPGLVARRDRPGGSAAALTRLSERANTKRAPRESAVALHETGSTGFVAHCAQGGVPAAVAKAACLDEKKKKRDERWQRAEAKKKEEKIDGNGGGVERKNRHPTQ